MNGEAARRIVRDLAKQVCEIAATPEQEKIKQRWRDVNALRKPDRAPVWCKPVGAWKEILPEDKLECSPPRLRSLERAFRRDLIKHDIGDDTPIYGRLDVPAVFDVEPPNVWGLDIGRHKSGSEDGAWGYDPPLKTKEDFARLSIPQYTFNREKTEDILQQSRDTLRDILEVRLVCHPPLGATLCNPAANLRGLTEMMMDLAADPDFSHRLMRHVRDGVLASMDAVEASGLLTPNNYGPMNESEPVGPESVDGTYTCGNLWCMANSQEFDQVSPAMWEEFLLNYQKPIFERFGLVGYGCCENLTPKINGVLSIPNLRIFVCSAWTDLDTVLDKVGLDYTIMWRQKASDVVFPDDDAVIRQELFKGMEKLQGRFVQIVLRELQTLSGRPDRLHTWTRYAIEAAGKFA